MADAFTDTDLHFFNAESDDSASPSKGPDDLGSHKAMSTTIAPSHMAMKMVTMPQNPVAPLKHPVAFIQQVLSTPLGEKPISVKSDKLPPKHDPDKEIIIGDKRYVLQDEKPSKSDVNTIQW